MAVRKIEVWLEQASEPIVHRAISTYQKGDFFCVRGICGTTWKYPVTHIFRVIDSADTTSFDHNMA